MKKLLALTTLLLALTPPAQAHHAMTQAEFRKVLHERDAAFARAYLQAEREQQQAEQQAQVAELHSLNRLLAHDAAVERRRQQQQKVADAKFMKQAAIQEAQEARRRGQDLQVFKQSVPVNEDLENRKDEIMHESEALADKTSPEAIVLLVEVRAWLDDNRQEKASAAAKG